MHNEKEYLSKEKHEELQKELDQLTRVRRREIADDLEYARSLGDLSENAEYHQARELQAKIEERIFQIETILRNAEILPETHTKGSTVSVGSSVTVRRHDGDERVFHIVGSEEANTAEGKISLNSPMGSAMRGKGKGDSFTFTTPAGKKIEYTIVKIS